MRDATAQKLLQRVSSSYNSIANEFSDTRQYTWEEFKYFHQYLFEDAEILDLGCGNGRLIKFLDQYFLGQKYRYLGIDNSSGLLEQASKHFPQKTFLPGDQLDIPVTESQVDLLFNIAALHHIPSKKLRLEALFEMKRVLKPNGVLIITVWNLWQKKYWVANLFGWLRSIVTLGDYAPNDLFIPWKNSAGKIKSKRYYHNFLPSELNKLIEQAGYTIVDCFSARKGEKTTFGKGFNYIVIAEKND